MSDTRLVTPVGTAKTKGFSGECRKCRLERLGDRVRDRRRRPGEVVAAELAAADPRVKVPDQAAFRIDFPRFRGCLPPAKQDALDLLAAGWGTGATMSCLTS